MNPAGPGTRFWQSPLWRMRLWSLIAALALGLMEAAAASLWYQAAFHITATPWSGVFAILFKIYLGSFSILRAMEAFHLKMAARRWIFLLWILLAGYLSLKMLVYPASSLGLFDLMALTIRYILQADVSGESFFHLIIVILITWRGVSIARSPVTTSGVHTSFQFGLMGLLLYGMIFAPQHPVEAMIGLYLFLYSGLTAMGMARVASLSELRGGRIPRIGTGWVASILLAAVAVTLLAAAAGWLASGRLMELLAFGLLIIIAILTAIVMIILSPLLAYFAQILPLLAQWIEKLMDRLRMLPISRQLERLISVVNDVLEKAQPFLLAGRSLILLLILAAVIGVVLLALYLRKQRFRLVEEGESEIAQLDETGNFLQKFVRRILHDARRLRLRRPAQILAAARIRRIYRQLMSLSKKLGEERAPSTTPLEFMPALSGLFPDDVAGLRLITGAYLKVRYGEYPETAGEMDQVEAAWERIHRQGRKAALARRQAKK